MSSDSKAFSAGIVVVRRSDEGWRFLMLRAWDYWDFPKGMIEAGEDALAGAIRETAEEAGITELAFNWGEVFCETEPYSKPRKVARYYLAETTQQNIVLGINPKLGQPEHHEGAWLSAEEALERAAPRIAKVIEWAREPLPD